MKSGYKTFILFFMAIAMGFGFIACSLDTPPRTGDR